MGQLSLYKDMISLVYGLAKLAFTDSPSNGKLYIIDGRMWLSTDCGRVTYNWISNRKVKV